MTHLMKITLPEHVRRIIETLSRNGYEAFAVGGCVRDTLLGQNPQDWDITTSALPDQVKALFRRTIDTGIEHGTVTVMQDHIGYEVTTYRIDGEYEDARHPKDVTFTSNLVEDLKRRDFTINAMAYNDEQGLIDVFDGAGDLEKGIIRCVGDPMERFSEDALRMLRAVRFAAQLGFSIEEETKKAVKTLAPTIAKVSAERIQGELVKLLSSGQPQEIRTAYELGLTAVFFPEFDEMMQTPQNTPHHQYTVGEHTIHALQGIRADRTLRLVMLFHDIAKPDCRRTDSEGWDHFYGHPKEGVAKTRAIMNRLKFDRDTTDRVCRMVLWHDDRPSIQEQTIRHTISRIGTDLYPDLFEVKLADTLAQSDFEREEKLAYIEDYRRMYDSILEKKQCLSKKEMAVGGRDLISLGMKQGPHLGEVLDRLFCQVLDHPEDNHRETLLAYARELINKQLPNRNNMRDPFIG